MLITRLLFLIYHLSKPQPDSHKTAFLLYLFVLHPSLRYNNCISNLPHSAEVAGVSSEISFRDKST